MKNYLKQFKYALVMLITGLCPMGIGVVFVVIIGEKYSSFIMGLSMFVGAVLCIFVMKKQFDISAKDVFKMPKPDVAKKLFRSYWFRQSGQSYISSERCRGL